MSTSSTSESQSSHKAEQSSTKGNDAVCFTAGGLAAVSFGAGTIHAYLAADRDAPAVAAGISMGAISAAALQRCLLEREAAKKLSRPAGEAKRWEWFRKYLLEISDQPLNIFWDAIPDQSDFFADRPPIRNTATPPCLFEAESSALEQRYLLTKLGWWLGNMPISVGKAMNVLVSYVRWKENYPGHPWVHGARCVWALVRVLVGLLWYLIKPWKSFFPVWQFGEKSKKRWIDRPLFGWGIWGGACLFFLGIPSSVLLFFHYKYHALGNALLTGLWISAITSFSILLIVVLVFLEVRIRNGIVKTLESCAKLGFLSSQLCSSLLKNLRGAKTLRNKVSLHCLKKLKIERGLLSDFHLRAKLTRIFDPEGKKAPITAYPMPVVIVAASLQTASQDGSDNSSVPLTTQLWAQPIEDPQNPGIPLIDALRAALSVPGLFAPVRVQSDKLRYWCNPQVLQSNFESLDLVDGSVIRTNPLPALFSFLEKRSDLAKQIAKKNTETSPGVHVIYSVPLNQQLVGVNSFAEDQTNIVDGVKRSLLLSRRRDTQVEVEQTNFIAKLAELTQDKDLLQFKIYADGIAPESDITFNNHLNPERDEIFKIAAAGCRQTLQTLYRQQLKNFIGSDPVSCSDLLRTIATQRDWSVWNEQPGLPEICEQCTQKFQRPIMEPVTGCDTSRTSQTSFEEPQHQFNTSAEKQSLPNQEIMSLLPAHYSDALPPTAQTIAEIDASQSAHVSQSKEWKPRIVFVASGGVFRGSFHIGMIAALLTTNIRPNFIVGASVGTLIGAALGAIMSVEPKDALELLAKLVHAFLHVDQKIALTTTLKSAARELGIRGQSINLSPFDVASLIRGGSRDDAGYAAIGAPPALIDAISTFFLIPHLKTKDIAASFVAGHVSRATEAFLEELKEETLDRLHIQYAVMGSSLLEPLVGDLLGGNFRINLHQRQPFRSSNVEKSIYFYATTTDLGAQRSLVLGEELPEELTDGEWPYDFVQAALASSAFPAVFTPRRDSEVFPGSGRIDVRYADGGLFDNVPFFPAINNLAKAQRKFRERQKSLSVSDFLEQRYDRPDLLLAGSLNVNPRDDGEGNSSFDSLASIRRRAASLQNNVKIRSFEGSSDKVDKQVRRLRDNNSLNNLCAQNKKVEDFVDGIVNAAVLPVFPSDLEHLNGTFAFSASTGFEIERARKSIADGCYQTLRAFCDTQIKADEEEKKKEETKEEMSLVSRSVKALMKEERIPPLQKRPKEAESSLGADECPYFQKIPLEKTLSKPSLLCPFAQIASSNMNTGLKEAGAVYVTCKGENRNK